MVDLTLVTGLVTTLKTAVDIAKTAKELNDISQVQGKVIEMQSLIMDAQSAGMAAQTQLYEVLHENSELKRKVSEQEEWKAVASRYALKDFGSGTFALELKDEAKDGEPTHRLCPVCFGKQTRSFLQFQGVTSSKQDFYKCLPCGHDYFFGHRDDSVWARHNGRSPRGV